MADTHTPTEDSNGSVQGITLVNVENDAVMLDHADVASNADLYVVTPPAYTQSITDGETTVDAEVRREEKHAVLPQQAPEMSQPLQIARRPVDSPSMQSEANNHIESSPAQAEERSAAYTPTHISPTQPGPPTAVSHYLTEPYTAAQLVGIRSCSVLHDRPAIWLVKRKKLALSPLAAAVLTKEGILSPKDLELLTQHPAMRRDPTDPLSGIILGTYDVLGEMMLGLAAGSIELGRQATPALERQKNGGDLSGPATNMKGVPAAAGKVVVEQGKGFGRVATATLKSPALLAHGLARGLHNLPKVYGEEVREYENVTGIKSGLRVSAKSFGYGLGDGMMDLFEKPIQGAEKNGVVGFATGFAVGLSNAAFKPLAGAAGVIGYSSMGVYKSIRSIKLSPEEKINNATLVQKLGGEEYERASDADKLYIVQYWCQKMMRLHLK